MDNTRLSPTARIFSEIKDFERNVSSQFAPQPYRPVDDNDMSQRIQEDLHPVKGQINPSTPSQNCPVRPLESMDSYSPYQHHRQLNIPNNVVPTSQPLQFSGSPSGSLHSSHGVGSVSSHDMSSSASPYDNRLMYAPGQTQHPNDLSALTNRDGTNYRHNQQHMNIGSSFIGNLKGLARSIGGGGNDDYQQQYQQQLQAQRDPPNSPHNNNMVSETASPRSSKTDENSSETTTLKPGPKKGNQMKKQFKNKVRESHACNICKDKRVSCDTLNGYDKSCQRCIKRKAPCMQVVEGRSVERGHLGRLESRIKELEAQLTAIKIRLESMDTQSQPSQTQQSTNRIVQPQAQEIQQPIAELAQSQERTVRGPILRIQIPPSQQPEDAIIIQQPVYPSPNQVQSQDIDSSSSS